MEIHEKAYAEIIEVTGLEIQQILWYTEDKYSPLKRMVAYFTLYRKSLSSAQNTPLLPLPLTTNSWIIFKYMDPRMGIKNKPFTKTYTPVTIKGERYRERETRKALS